MRRGVPQGEALAVWGLLVADVLAILVVYSVVDPSELYAVTKSGLEGGLGRALVQLNIPSVAGTAVALVLLASDSLPRRAWLVGGPAIALCAVIVWPGVVEPSHLDAKPVNAIPAVGVVLAFALTVAAARTAGTGFAPRRAGDPARVVVGTIAVLVALPWIAAELGFHFPQGVFLTTKLYAEPHKPPTAAVHLGHHHGMMGTLMVLSALALSRPRLGSPRLQRIYAFLVSLMLVYGATNVVNDFWHEQVVKRGWSSSDVPSALVPGANPIWAIMLGAAVVLYVAGFARRDSATSNGDNHG
jgi:hypothetical protein